jgi:hypothetical protein
MVRKVTRTRIPSRKMTLVVVVPRPRPPSFLVCRHQVILKPRCATVTRAISAAKVAARAMAKRAVVRSRG